MSDNWINIRFYTHHLQIGPRGFSFRLNRYLEKDIRAKPWYDIDKWIDVCTFYPFIR